MSLKAKLTLLSGLFVAGMVVLWVVAFLSLNQVKVGGQLYSNITTSNQLEADYAPPPGFLMGSRLEILAMLADVTNDTALHEDIQRFETAAKVFEDTHTQYVRILPDGRVKDLLQKSYEPGHQYLELAESQYIPLVLKGKVEEAQAVRQNLVALFRIHNAAIGELLEAAAAWQATSEKTAASTVSSRTFILVTVAVVAIALVLALCTVIARGILKPLRSTVEVLHEVSKGNLTRHLEVTGTDEIAQMSIALNETVDNLSRVIADINADARVLSGTSEKLSTTSNQLKLNSQQTTVQAGAVSAAAEQVNQNVQTLSTATEEMSSSIKEISKNASEAAEVASSAARLAGTTTSTMTKLSESSAEIGNVIKVITSIAEQTNLLALNATIEAARAGEAGKGFAVVATEVKELAKETAKATEDIGNKVEAIQNDAKGAVQAIDEITTVIGRINDIQNTIASAVEEQTGTTNEISRNIAETAKGSSDIASNITGVANAATETQQTAAASEEAAGELAQLAARLNNVVTQFTLVDNRHPTNGRQAIAG